MSLKNVDHSFKYALGQAAGQRLTPVTVAVGSVLAAGSLQAATITVTTLEDGAVAGECSLRAAVYSATQNSAFNNCAAGDGTDDIVEFDAALSGNLFLDVDASLYSDSSIRIGESVTIRGNGNVAIVGTGDAPVFYAKYNESVQTERFAIENLTITGGGGNRGGAIYSLAHHLSVSHSTLSGNHVFNSGGAISHRPINLPEGNLELNSSVISGNTAESGCGGGIFLSTNGDGASYFDRVRIVDNEASCGGGVFVYGYGPAFASGEEGDRFYLRNSEVSDNRATSANIGDGGGGIYARLRAGSRFELSNSTISQNSAQGNGGGIRVLGGAGFNVPASRFFVEYSTIAENQAFGQGGGIYTSGASTYFGDSVCSIANSIISANQLAVGPQELTGPILCTVAHSLVKAAASSEFTDSGGNILEQDPLLYPLAFNGGWGGHTHALVPTSPAIDAGNHDFAPAFDQRGPGYSRIAGEAIDMGAYELQIAGDKIFSDRFEQP